MHNLNLLCSYFLCDEMCKPCLILEIYNAFNNERKDCIKLHYIIKKYLDSNKKSVAEFYVDEIANKYLSHTNKNEYL